MNEKKVGCAITPRHQIQILCSACVGVGVQSQEQKGSHQPTPALIITAAEPALGSEQTNEMQKPTHCDSVHNKRCIANTVTYKPFTHKHTSMSGYNSTDMNRQELDFTETYGNRRVQGIISTDPPPPSPPERKEAVRRLVPTEDQRTCRPSWCFTYRQPDTCPCATPKP